MVKLKTFRCSIAEDYTIYPWLHQNVNNVKRTDQTEPSRFPDVVPILNSPLPNFSMVAGDFLEVYNISKNDLIY